MKEHKFISKVDTELKITIPKEIIDNSNINYDTTVMIECMDDNTICISPKV